MPVTTVRFFIGVLSLAVAACFSPAVRAQSLQDGVPDLAQNTAAVPPTRVEVAPQAADAAIDQRLERILTATSWYTAQRVRVDEGVVFLHGRAKEERQRQWAGDLARRTEGVVAVVNRIDVEASPLARWGPAVEGLTGLWATFLRTLPALMLGIFSLLLAYCAGRVATWLWRASFRRRESDIVREITARAAGLLLFLLGVYLALRIAGLTRLAATVLGGTGIVGLVLGIAFRDIVENVLASILLTRQQPFRKGDLVEIAGIEGYVQRLTVRATVLMNLEGNHVQIPNSTVYKSAIRNFTSNPARRVDFLVGIGYADSIAHAQQVALSVISEHPAVLPQPEPWVLETLGSSAVQLRVYVWLDGTKHSWLKVRSSVIRLVKRAFQQHAISMPDEAREVVFPDGVPIRLPSEQRDNADGAAERERARELPGSARRHAEEASSVATDGEAGLASDAAHMGRLANESRSPEEGRDLLSRDAAGE